MKTTIHEFSIGNVGCVQIKEDARGNLGDVEVAIIGITSIKLNLGLFKQFVYDLGVVREFIKWRTGK